MSAVASPPTEQSYFDDKIQQVNVALAEALERQTAAHAKVDIAYPACEKAVAAMQEAVRRGGKTYLDELMARAAKAANKEALGLLPVAGGKKRQWLLWAFLLVLLPSFVGTLTTGYSLAMRIAMALQPWTWTAGSVIGWLFMCIPSAGLYWWLIKLGRARLAKRANQGVSTLIESFGKGGVVLVQFSDVESGNAEYPYNAVRAPWPKRALFDTWRINPKLGSQLGATFAGFLMPNEPTAFHSLLRLDGEPLLIDIKGQHSAAEWLQLRDFGRHIAPSLAAHIPVARALGEQAEALRSVIDEVGALERRLATLTDAAANWSDVALDPAKLDQMLKLVDLFASGRKPAPKGFLMYGPPGTGKTLIARKLAKSAGCHFESVTIGDLKGAHIGHTAPKVKEVWKRCRDHAPAILFVDECESAFARRGSTDTDAFGNELVQTFLAEWDGFQGSGQVMVVGATNRRDILDDAIVSRFTTTVEIGVPNAAARRKILRHELRQARINVEVPEALVNETTGMSGRDLHTLVASVVADSPSGDIDADGLLATVRKLRGKGSTQVKELTWDDIVLPPRTREEFEGLGKELRNSEQLAALGIPAPRGILLYGPPGTGKTQVARVLASQSGLAFVSATTADLKANYVGQSGGKVKAVFERARAQAPCILFIDEIDIVAPSRDGGSDTFAQEIVGQLLQELDGVASKGGQVFLLAASNHPDRIDSALLSRMERKVEIGLPDADGRERIIGLLLAGKPLDFDPAQAARDLAAQTAGWSGRDLQSLVTRATRSAVKRTMLTSDDASQTRLMREDLDQALASAD